MKLTNKLQLPDAIVEAVRNDKYSRGDSQMSVTGLLRPPRLSVLEAIHAEDIEEDVSDRIWSLFGQAVHSVLERSNRVAIAERRLSMEVEGWKISGGMDLYEDGGILSDYKTTSVWKVIKGDLDEWTKQLNMYSVILRHHGHEVNKLQVIAILRDWSKMEADRDPLYPQAQVVNIEIPVWDKTKAFLFMRDRVILHQQALFELPECTAQDRWEKPSVYAVMKAGAKRALKLYDNENEAKAHVGFDKQLSVVHRPGESVRCAHYCPVSKFCMQYQSTLNQKELAHAV